MQDFPNQPIRLITTGSKGGRDLVARLIAHGISGPLRQPVTVDNLAGSSAIELVAKAPPDGYTLLVLGPSFWTAPLLQKVAYDPVQDFSPITVATTSPLVVVAGPSLAANSIQDLIASAKARPGELKYASGLNGSSSHIAGALFTFMAGLNMVRIPYEGTAVEAVNDLIAGKVDVMIFSAGSGMQHVKAGKLRALAVTSAEPSALTPGLPTVNAAGLPGYEAAQTMGVFAPAKTPATIIERLNREIVQFLKTPAAKEQLLDAGLEVVGGTPQALAVKVKSEMDRLSKVIKSAHIKPD